MTRIFRRGKQGLAMVAAASAMLACGHKATTSDPGSTADDLAQLAADGNEAAASAAQSTHVGNLIWSAVSSQDPSAAATSVTGTQLWPSGCVTRTKDAKSPLVVHVKLDDCTGPFGLVHLTGEEVVSFSSGPTGALVATFTSTTLTANGMPIVHSATAEITVKGSERDVHWTGSWTRMSDKGETVSHTSDLTVVVDTAAGCRTIDGEAQTAVAGREVDSRATGYRICNAGNAEGCPSGTLVYTSKATGKQLTVQFDGSKTAEVQGPAGRTFAVPLVCGG